MATLTDQAVGMSLVGFSLLLFIYYSVWVIVLVPSPGSTFTKVPSPGSTFTKPFMDTAHVLHKYFIPREYSVILPGIAAVILLLFIGAFTGVVIWKKHKPKKAD